MRAIGLAVVQLGGGRLRAGDRIDPAVGLSALSPVAQAVGPGAPLAVLHAGSESAWERAAEAVRNAITVAAETPAASPVVHSKVTGDAVDEPA